MPATPLDISCKDSHNQSFINHQYDTCRAFYAPDLTCIRTNGRTLHGTEAGSVLTDDYSVPTAFTDEPVSTVITETPEGGYHFVDTQGKRWEAKTSTIYVGDVAKDASGPDGYKLAHLQTFGDPNALLGLAIKRGVVSADVLLG
ncbi:hypothetical protein OQA88_10564 [Cercophora sp. LCS_1]